MPAGPSSLVEPIVDDGLGNSMYVVDLGGGRALVVDVCLDLRAVRATAEKRSLTLAFAADTHLHADFVSGARQLAASDGATVLASSAGHRQFEHEGLRDGDEVDLGGLTLRALATPGHTDEHLSFLLLDARVPVGVFTGGCLLVGAAARTDLVDPDRTEELARAQYASLQRLLTLPDDVAVWPTHGAGSFCSAPPGTQRISTIGRERTTNPLVRAPDEDAFVQALLGSLGSFPTYFARLPTVNRRGPALLQADPGLAPLDVASLRAFVAAGGDLVDVRPASEFAAGHLPHALSIPLRPVFATWLGWLTSPDRPIAVVRGPDQDPAEVAWQAAKIGYGNVVAELDRGIDAWVTAGLPTASTVLARPGELQGRWTLDVRQDREFTAGHVPGAVHVELGSLPHWLRHLPPGPGVVMCAHGERAMTAASLVERSGRRDIAVTLGGPDDWTSATGGVLAAMA